MDHRLLVSCWFVSAIFLGCAGCQYQQHATVPPKAEPAAVEESKAPEVNPAELLDFIAESLEERDLRRAGNLLIKAEKYRDQLSEVQQKQFAELHRQLQLLEEGQETPSAQLREAEAYLKLDQLAEAQLALQTLPEIESLPSAQAARALELKDRLAKRLELMEELKQAALAEGENANRLWQEPSLGIQALAAAWQESPRQQAKFLAQAVHLAQRPEEQRILAQQLQRTQPIPAGELPPVSLGPVSRDFLEVALNSAEQAERRVALHWLATIEDPPEETFFALLPMCRGDSPLLAETCLAMDHAAWVHHQRELLAVRNPEMSAEQRAELKTFRTKLLAWATSAELAQQNPAVSSAVKRLAITVGSLQPQPLANISVFAVSGEDPNHPAEAVLDGKWPDKDEPTTQWYSPIDRPTWIVLDLGSEQPVCGVRIWNYCHNHDWGRGFQDVYVTVSENPSDFQKHARGFVPKGTYENTRQDFSTRIDFPLRTGRFVILRCGRSWHQAHRAGLAEVQVLSPPAAVGSGG